MRGLISASILGRKIARLKKEAPYSFPSVEQDYFSSIGTRRVLSPRGEARRSRSAIILCEGVLSIPRVLLMEPGTFECISTMMNCDCAARWTTDHHLGTCKSIVADGSQYRPSLDTVGGRLTPRRRQSTFF